MLLSLPKTRNAWGGGPRRPCRPILAPHGIPTIQRWPIDRLDGAFLRGDDRSSTSRFAHPSPSQPALHAVGDPGRAL